MKILFKVFFLSILLAFITSPAYAQPEADQSARLLTLEVYDYTTVRMAKKKIAINSLLKKYNSPLVSSIDSFLNTCTSYSLDCYLLPSIAGLESSFGKHVLPGSNNPFGWGGGLIIFDSWDQAIAAVGKGLKYNYIDRGANSVEKIAPIYAESKTWAPRVRKFMDGFMEEERKMDAIFTQNEVNL